MKRFLLAVLIGGSFAALPAAKADSFNFTYSAPGGVSGSGTLVGTYLGPDTIYGTEDWLITSGSGTFDDGSQTGAMTLVANPNADGSSESSPSGSFTYDDILLVPASGGTEWLDYNGLLFSFAGGELNFWDGGYTYVEGWAEDSGPNGAGSFTVVTNSSPVVPEPGSLLLMGTGMLGLALVLLKGRRASDSEPAPASALLS